MALHSPCRSWLTTPQAWTPALLPPNNGPTFTGPAGETLVVFETCDCCGWVYDLCAALGLRASVVAANTEAWQWRRVKRKTDRDDALKLAKLAVLDQLTIVHMPSPVQRQKRRL